MSSIKATDRIDNGLKCSASVGVSSSLTGTSASFWSPFTYTLVLDANDADGWNASFVTFPERFSEEYALAHPDMIKIHFGDKDLSLAEARQASAAVRARDAEYERQLAARAAYEKSPAGRAEAAAKQREEEVDNARRARACEAHGGTWGYRQNPWGPLGCYFQTVGK